MEPTGSRRARWTKFAVTISVVVVVASSAAYLARSAFTSSKEPGPVTTASHTSHSHTRPNIVLIVTDDQRWDSLWAMPNVRRDLVAHGVNFTNAFVTTSLCCPS